MQRLAICGFCCY